MTEAEVKGIMGDSFGQVKPIIEKMTHLIMDAYQKGFLTGMEIGKHFTSKQ